MNPKPIFKWVALVTTSTILAVSTVHAEPGKGKGKSDDKPEKSEKKAHKAERKAVKNENKEDQRSAKNEDRRDKQLEKRVYQKGEFKERFQDRDRDRVVTYFSGYKGQKHGLPPELARNWENGRRLPSGWRDRVVTGYVIENDWQPAFQPVPYHWFPDVVVVPDTRLYWYGDRVVRVYEPTREVVDVIIIPTIHIDL
ncbi:MAG: hypothetical protein V4584_18120 [Verrucomicrobiota bacterium]